MQKKAIFTVMILLIVAFNLLAGDAPANFSGEWKLDEAKSTLDDMGSQFLPTSMKIEQTADSLSVTKTFSSDFGDDFSFTQTISLDGKECTVEFMNSPRTSTANWSEDKKSLKIKTIIIFNMDGNESEITVNEEWSLDKDEKNLLNKYSSQSNFGERDLSLVLTKIEKEKK